MESTRHEIAVKVAEAIARHPAPGIDFAVNEADIHRRSDWWRVALIPTNIPDRLYPVLEVLSEIEEDLRGEQGIDVLLSLGEPEASPSHRIAH